MADMDDESKADVTKKIDSLRKQAADGELGDELLDEVAGGTIHTNGSVHTNGWNGDIHTNGSVHTNSGAQQIAD